jgi:hypothetical protein
MNDEVFSSREKLLRQVTPSELRTGQTAPVTRATELVDNFDFLTHAGESGRPGLAFYQRQ